MTDIVFLLLLILHVAAIVAWMGGGVLFVSVVSPSLTNMSPPARTEFIKSTLPRYFRFITGTSIMAIIAGVLLYAYVTVAATDLAPSSSGQFSGQIAIQAGAVLGLIALVFVLGFAMPAGRKLVSLVSQPGKPPDANMAGQIAGLQRRLTMGARLGLVLLMITLILMILGAEL